MVLRSRLITALCVGAVLASSICTSVEAHALIAEDARLNAFLDSAYDLRLTLSPQRQTMLGIRSNYGQLDDYTPAGQDRELAMIREQVAAMRRDFDKTKLGPQASASYELFEEAAKTAEENARWRDYNFTFTAVGAPTTAIPSFLINSHKIESVADAEAYISRLREVERVMREVGSGVELRIKKGTIEPRFILAPAIASATRVITGAPFGAGADSALWADLQEKIGKLGVEPAIKQRLLDAGKAALVGPVERGYRLAIAALELASKHATSDDGVWRLPDGSAYYATRVRISTGTDLTPDHLHDIGVREMKRIRTEMEALKQRIGFRGTLEQFFEHVKSRADLHYSNDDGGRAQYLADAQAAVGAAMSRSTRFFNRSPQAKLEVRAVEPWREAVAPVAFYSGGSPDGTRPGIMYVNLSDLTGTLKPLVQAIACHEGAPGHHFEASFALEMSELPRFRRHGAGYIPFGEGWGLYAEGLCKEMGVIRDPYSDFGRLSQEGSRAARLVVDTGLNAKRWSRAEARDYLKSNTLLSDLDIAREVDRYLSIPGQATSYKIGQLKILELRRKAEAALGSKFDVRDFHDAILSGGGVPLDMLERQVDVYIDRVLR